MRKPISKKTPVAKQSRAAKTVRSSLKSPVLKYLIHLEDNGGDEYYFTVGSASWAWIHAPRPAFDATHGATEVVPAAVMLEFAARPARKGERDSVLSVSGDEDADKRKCEVTSGSYENDRVLHLLFKFSRTQSEKRPRGSFADVYHGCIY